jgi:hypothetical protein
MRCTVDAKTTTGRSATPATSCFKRDEFEPKKRDLLDRMLPATGRHDD